MEKEEKAYIIWSVNVINWHNGNICEDMITWHAIYIGNYVKGGGFERASKWYEQKPEGVLENENCKLLWDFTIQCDRMVEARRPDIVFVDKKKKREIKILDVAVPSDGRVKDKELEKIEKYQLLKEEVGRIWE